MISIPFFSLLVGFLTLTGTNGLPQGQKPIRLQWPPYPPPAGPAEKRPTGLPCIQVHCAASQGPPGTRDLRSTMDLQVYVDGHYTFALHSEKNAHARTVWDWHGLVDHTGATWDIKMNGFCGNAEYRKVEVAKNSNMNGWPTVDGFYSLATVRSHQEVDWDCLDNEDGVQKCSLWETVHENKRESTCAVNATPRLCFYRAFCETKGEASATHVLDTTDP